ncbi:Domain of unknown function DUF1821 [Gloeothece citriformis PCC 7424]|uniref:DNA-binding domain-containing protein n=1 Tax=Gloeothece citriformis (strain PCC 7424) TaxID=65393 RepID=B7KAJ2_GLOC7|nr:hypothetical protein [Gloeothece citriformis]ACK68664.1 Domain of unknown function DUF1821 [Gloeothece citriformis PCC 7424]
MQSQEITSILIDKFGEELVAHPSDDAWQVDTPEFRLLVILTDNREGLRLLLPICPASQAQPYLTQLLQINFAQTQGVHYGLHQEVLWGVYAHPLPSLTPEDLKRAIADLLVLQEKGLSECFNLLIETQIRLIIKAAKQQGQSLEATLQNLDRLYAEGLLGGLSQDPQERDQFLAAWRYQLDRLWDEES